MMIENHDNSNKHDLVHDIREPNHKDVELINERRNISQRSVIHYGEEEQTKREEEEQKQIISEVIALSKEISSRQETSTAQNCGEKSKVRRRIFDLGNIRRRGRGTYWIRKQTRRTWNKRDYRNQKVVIRAFLTGRRN